MRLTVQRKISGKFRPFHAGSQLSGTGPEIVPGKIFGKTPGKAQGLIRWSVALIFPFLLVSCAAIQDVRRVKLKRVISRNKSIANPKIKVVLNAVARHLLSIPRDDFVWLWNKPGGMRKRAMRIKKIPSGTVGTVLEFEPEPSWQAAWAYDGLENHMRSPIRWVKVVTSHGLGWVRTEFIDPR